VESKWRKLLVGTGPLTDFVKEEFGPGGQLRETVVSLRSLFDPHQERLDRDYWQRTLFSLIEEAPAAGWNAFRQAFGDAEWDLVVDGCVYVHQYTMGDTAKLARWEQELQVEVAKYIGPQDAPYFGLDNTPRLRLTGYPELVRLLGGGWRATP